MARRKPTQDTIIYNALIDAIDWQNSIAASYGENDVNRKQALYRVELYRGLMQKKFGESRTPMEKLGDNAKTIGIYDVLDKFPKKEEK